MDRAIRDDSDAQLAEAVISVDTFHSAVARAAVEAGADMVNDVSGGLLDPAMHSTVRLHIISPIHLYTRTPPGHHPYKLHI